MSSTVFFESLAEPLYGICLSLSERLKGSAYALDTAVLEREIRPSFLVATTAAAAMVITLLLIVLRRLFPLRGLKRALHAWVRSLLYSQEAIQREEAKLKAQLAQKKKRLLRGDDAITCLPAKGWSADTLLNHLKERNMRNAPVSATESKISGAVYMTGNELESLLRDVYQLHSLTSPLHPDIFPSVCQMEAEVVSICANLLNPLKTAKHICGAMTGGGSESILSAVKASRNYLMDEKNITEPEMIIAQSAHPAYHKAADAFNIKLIILETDKNFQMPLKELKNSITSNTVLIVASAPGFPHGVIDPIEEISDLAQEFGTLLHVDCCLGGFSLPFVRKLGYTIPPFDFSLEGVTSISVDTHKYGMSHKGTSVVLYRCPALRRHQYTAVSEWTGGLYISPGFAGSRSGALISTAWASLMYHGEQGFVKVTEDIMKAVHVFCTKLAFIPDLEIVGNPIGSVVAVKFKENPERIYQVNDIMSEKGWHLTPLQFPAALHISFTARHANVADRLIQDLRASVKEAASKANDMKPGSVAIYGTACTVPDRRIVKELLHTYQDTLLSPCIPDAYAV